jgi:hypothetical protein
MHGSEEDIVVVVERGRLLVGVALLAIGGVLLAGHAGWLDAGAVLATWWPVLVIGAGLLKLAERPRDLGGALAVTGAGIVLLAWRLDLVGAVLLPIAFIAAGIVVLFRAPHAEQRQVLGSDVQVGDLRIAGHSHRRGPLHGRARRRRLRRHRPRPA